MPTHEYWPPRVICEGMKGPDVEVMSALLKAQEYGVHYSDSYFSAFLTERVKAYQTDKGLKPDGIVGPLTWGELLKIKSL
jgi:murein L,D-transpeptidase YcbB/YkuD